MNRKLRVGILGATGTVGQKFVVELQNHPWFEITALAASKESAGRKYGELMNEAKPGLKCDFVFSGLDAVIAKDIESSFAKTGYPVISNAKTYRLDDDVPLLVPEVNADHIKQFAYYPELRFEVSNGQTLCEYCHKATPTYRKKRKVLQYATF